MQTSHWFVASTHNTFNLIGPCHRHPYTQSQKARKIHTLRPLTYKLFFPKSSIMVCACAVDHYYIRVEIHQMAQTHKKVNKIHSVEIRSLTTNTCIHMKRTHHPPLTHHLIFGLHFHSDDSIIWSHKRIFDSPYPKHWHHLDYILTRRAILSCVKLSRSLHDSSEGDTDHSLV